MALTPRLDIKQSQSLVLTPQLQQAIKMLQLSSLELVEFVADEVAQNPLLEYDETTPERNDRENENDATKTEKPAREETEAKTTDDFLQERDPVSTDNDTPLDTDYSEMYDDSVSDQKKKHEIKQLRTNNISKNIITDMYQI